MTITLAISEGGERELEAISAQVGRNLLQVTPGQLLSPPGRGRGWYLSSRLDDDDVALLSAEVSGLAAVAPVLEGSRRVELGRESVVTNVRGVTPEYLALRFFEVADGRPFDAEDERERRRVALLGASVAERLGRGGSLVGETIRVGRVPLEVVGELASKGMSPDGQNEDDQILVPLETARRRIFNRDALSRLLIQASSAERIPALESAARDLLRASHRIATGAKSDFEIVPMTRTSEIRRRSLGFLQGMSQLFAATTLAVGGAGVLAVTVLNVKERSWEIGLRRAVGARRRDIASLFVLEACALSAAGGAVGLLVGAFAVAVLERTLGWRMAVDLGGVAIPFGISVALGLLSGLVPALDAARATPVEALRSR
jgi:putative ABC transport system permease protein